MISGQLSDMVNYFAETDSVNFGKYGDYSTSVFIQDAWMELNVAPEFQFDMGMLLLPFSHQGMQGATSLHSLDYHAKLVRYPGGKVWRDVGVMARGLVLNNLIEYRLAITGGIHPDSTLKDATVAAKGDTAEYKYKYAADPRNAKDWPRVTARLVFNAFDAEGVPALAGFFYKGLYLKETPDGIISPKKILSLGGSVDWQKGANLTMDSVPGSDKAGSTRDVAKTKDYLGLNADVFLDMPLSDDKTTAIAGQVDFYYYNHGDRSKGLSYYDLVGNKELYSGVGIASELGVRFNAIEPIICFDWFNSTKVPSKFDDVADYMAIYGGINYFWMAHAVTFKLEVGAQKEGRMSVDKTEVIKKFAPFGTVQAQLVL